MLKGNLSDVYFHKYMKIKINSDDDFTFRKKINMYDVEMLVKFVFIKNHKPHYHQAILEKCSYK